MASNSINLSDVDFEEAIVGTVGATNVALKPGHLAKYDANGHFVSTDDNTNDGKRDLFVMGLNPSNNDGVDATYTVGDTALAYRLEPGKRYNVRLKNGTYTTGEALMVAGSGSQDGGIAAEATSGKHIIAFVHSTGAGTIASADSGQLTAVVGASRMTA